MQTKKSQIGRAITIHKESRTIKQGMLKFKPGEITKIKMQN